MSARKLLPILLVVGVAAVAAFVVLRRKVDLLVVNPSPAAVKVTVNGAAYDVPPTGQVLVEGVSPDLKLTADGAAITAGAADPATKTWVWSVAPVTSWWTVHKGYGDQVGAAPATTAFVPSSSPVFALPDDYARRVDATLPENATVEKGVTGAVLRALWSDEFARTIAPARVTLAIHNDSADAFRIERDGVKLTDLPADAVLHVAEHAAGPAKFRAVAVDAQGKETGKVYELDAVLVARAPFATPAAYVWDLVPTSNFRVMSRRYGPNPDAEGPPPAPTAFEPPAGSDGTFFCLPDGFFPELDAPYPDTWPRQEVLKFLWCDDFFQKQRAPKVPASLQRKLDEERAHGGGTPRPPGGVLPPGGGTPRQGPPAPPPANDAQPFPPVEGEPKAN